MENFFFSIPTKMHFGIGAAERVGEIAALYGGCAMLLYGGDAVKKTGAYDTVCKSLSDHGVRYVELPGIKANPRVARIDEGITLARRSEVKVLIPMGGGSTIDTAKAIASGVHYEGSAWEVVLHPELVKDPLPVIAVPTIAAAGSEMDSDAMIFNEETGEKKSLNIPSQYPAWTLADPGYTCSVPKRQSAAGTADILSHIMEVYFSRTDGAYFPDAMMEAMLRVCIQCGNIVCTQDRNDYDARANLLWIASLACSGLLDCGKVRKRWSVHPMEHAVGVLYDGVHGEGIAVLTIQWMRYILNEKTQKMFADFGRKVLGIYKDVEEQMAAEEAVDRLEAIFCSWGLPGCLRECGLTEKPDFRKVAEQAMGSSGKIAGIVTLKCQDIVNIYESAY